MIYRGRIENEDFDKMRKLTNRGYYGENIEDIEIEDIEDIGDIGDAVADRMTLKMSMSKAKAKAMAVAMAVSDPE